MTPSSEYDPENQNVLEQWSVDNPFEAYFALRRLLIPLTYLGVRAFTAHLHQ